VGWKTTSSHTDLCKAMPRPRRARHGCFFTYTVQRRQRETIQWPQSHPNHLAYQMQMPTKGPNKEIDNSKITELSDTLEIVYEGMYNLLDLQKGPAPIDITTTLTWVINRRSSGVYKRYRRQPYLRITISFDSKGKFGAIHIPESIFWREAYHKLLRYQLGCPVRLEFGMDRDPAQYITTFMRRAEVLVQTQLPLLSCIIWRHETASHSSLPSSRHIGRSSPCPGCFRSLQGQMSTNTYG